MRRGTWASHRLENRPSWQHIGLPAIVSTFLFAGAVGDLYLGLDHAGAYRSQDRVAPAGVRRCCPTDRASSVTATERADLPFEHRAMARRPIPRSGRHPAATGYRRGCPDDLHCALDGSAIVAGKRRTSVFRSDDDGETWAEHAPRCGRRLPGELCRTAERRPVPVGHRRWRRLIGRREPRSPGINSLSTHDGSPVSGLAVLANGDLLGGHDIHSRRDGSWRRRSVGRTRAGRRREAAGRVGRSSTPTAIWRPRPVRPARSSLERDRRDGRGDRRIGDWPRGGYAGWFSGRTASLYIATGTDGLDYAGDGASEGRIRISQGTAWPQSDAGLLACRGGQPPPAPEPQL